MRLKKLTLKNFRCFENLTITFPTDYTVFIGINGAGKSTVLDAICIFLDCFSSGNRLNQSKNFYGIFRSLKIQSSDVRRVSKLSGSILEAIPQYPILVEGNIEDNNNESIFWKMSLTNSRNIENDKNFEIRQLMDYLTHLHQKLVNGDEMILPIISYYGTNRRWMATEMEKIDNHEMIPPEYFIPRLKGYSNCLNSSIFQLESMRKWFARMLLIERKKNVPEFQAVKNAIETCYKIIDGRNYIQNVSVDYDAEKEDLEIQTSFIDGKNEILPLNSLSDGVKSILTIVADIAYRMAVLNPNLLGDVIQKTDGIVLIDEVDMHLHPSWQRRIVESLHKTFPKVQFIFTTHSPTVLTEIPKENIQVLDNGKIYTPDIHTRGRDVNSILREIMHSDIRPSAVTEKLDAFSKAIEYEDLEKAQTILDELKFELGENDSEVVGAQVTLDLERA